GRAEAPVPGARVGWELLDPEGKSSWQETVEEQWQPGTSKYFQGRKAELAPGMMGGGTTTKFDFKGRSMREAVLEEILDNVSGGLPRSFPRAIRRVDGETRHLPIKAEYATPAGP